MLEDSGLEPLKRLDVLDAGCGTGLCGPLVAPYARRLVGVDLSEGMLVHAKEKNVYHALMKAELTDYLHDNSEAFDLIVSADTLVYFGDLRECPCRRRTSATPEWAVRIHARAHGRRRGGCRLSLGVARSL